MGAAGGVGGGESIAAGLADLVAASVVFVVGGDVADRFVESHRVVVGADTFELGGVGDVQQVRVPLWCGPIVTRSTLDRSAWRVARSVVRC